MPQACGMGLRCRGVAGGFWVQVYLMIDAPLLVNTSIGLECCLFAEASYLTFYCQGQ